MTLSVNQSESIRIQNISSSLIFQNPKFLLLKGCTKINLTNFTPSPFTSFSVQVPLAQSSISKIQLNICKVHTQILEANSFLFNSDMGVIMDCLGKQNMTKGNWKSIANHHLVKLIAHAVTDEIKQNFSQISQLAENEGVEQDYSLIYSRSNCKVGTDLQLYKITKIWLDSAQLV